MATDRDTSPPLSDSEVRDRLAPVDVVALTAWGEARGDSRQGGSSVEERIAVLCVIRNRVETRAQPWKAVCLAPWQFSSWTPRGGSQNYAAVMSLARQILAGDTVHDALYLETRYLADGVMRGLVLDRVHGATLYYAPAAMRPAGAVPTWALNLTPVAEVGGQLFFRA